MRLKRPITPLELSLWVKPGGCVAAITHCSLYDAHEHERQGPAFSPVVREGIVSDGSSLEPASKADIEVLYREALMLQAILDPLGAAEIPRACYFPGGLS